MYFIDIRDSTHVPVPRTFPRFSTIRHTFWSWDIPFRLIAREVGILKAPESPTGNHPQSVSFPAPPKAVDLKYEREKDRWGLLIFGRSRRLARSTGKLIKRKRRGAKNSDRLFYYESDDKSIPNSAVYFFNVLFDGLGVLIEFFAILTFSEIMANGLRVDTLLFLSRPALLLKFLFLFSCFQGASKMSSMEKCIQKDGGKNERWILRIKYTENPSVLLLKIYALLGV